MNSRSLPSIVIAALVTVGLLFAMYALIRMNEPELSNAEQFKLPDFVHVPKNEDVDVITPKPERPDDVADQPDVPELEVTPDRVDVSTSIALGQVRLGINRELQGFNSNDGEYLPIFRAPPIYPRRAAERGLCGWVDLMFTVTSSGTVTNPQVTNSSSSLFESSAEKAALKYKYKPRQQGGKPVDVSGVEVRIVYEMEDGC